MTHEYLEKYYSRELEYWKQEYKAAKGFGDSKNAAVYLKRALAYSVRLTDTRKSWKEFRTK